MSSILEITIRKPDDFHVHLRGRPLLDSILPFTASQFARALVMPNVPWTADSLSVCAYREIIESQLQTQGISGFTPLMTMALTDDTQVEDVAAARELGAIACKLYPKSVTTGSQCGVTDHMARNLRTVYKFMAGNGMVLCIHAEAPGFPRLERERRYLNYIDDIIKSFKRLKIVIEHISTESSVYFVNRSPFTVAATITAHHLVDTIDDALDSPHNLCNPVPKYDKDREALWNELRWNEGRFFFGSDSAPHPVSSKHCPKPACGVFSAPCLLPRLATLFDRRGILSKLEPFVSEYGAKFYGLLPNDGTITLTRSPCRVPGSIGTADGEVVCWRGGETLDWSL
jgi:dihydroorotase